MKSRFILVSLLLSIAISSFASIQHETLSNTKVSYKNGLAGTAETLKINGTKIKISYDDFFGIYAYDYAGTSIYTNSAASASSDVLKLFPAGSVIDGTNSLNADGATGNGTVTPGNESEGIHYIGFRTAAGNNGWIKIHIVPGSHFEILEYAYESIPNEPITAGEGHI
jgi:hypothetical protein